LARLASQFVALPPERRALAFAQPPDFETILDALATAERTLNT
jgi:hypothetical protein